MEEVECSVELTTQAVMAACSADYTQVKQAEQLIHKLEIKPGFHPILAVSALQYFTSKPLSLYSIYTSAPSPLSFPYSTFIIRRCRWGRTFLEIWREWLRYAWRMESLSSGDLFHPSKMIRCENSCSLSHIVTMQILLGRLVIATLF